MRIRKNLNKLLGLFDLELIRASKNRDLDLEGEEFLQLYRLCAPYTMTPIERMFALYNAVNYVIDNQIPGDFVECGVWKGGSSMLIAACLNVRNVLDRKLFVYDTFSGMTKPGEEDVNLFGEKATDKFAKKATGEDSADWAYASLEEVKINMRKTGFPEENIIYVQGKVEDTLPKKAPEGDISLLRLDTDWYESTKHELLHLYPKLVPQGVLILDDYGHWGGAKQATLEYFAESSEQILLNKIDYAARIGVKVR